MKLSSIHQINESFEIEYYDSESWEDDDLDPYDVVNKAEIVAYEAGVRISSNKELKFVALDRSYSDPIIGGVWIATYHDNEQDAIVFDFDVAVDKEFRSSALIGLKLIETAIDEYKNLDYDRKYIKVWVINPKLVRVLERKYGFEIESEHGDGSAHMTYY